MPVIMNLRQLSATVAATTGQDEKEVEKTLREGFDAIAKLLAAQERLSVPNFGTFRTKERIARQIRNPQTGEFVQVPTKAVPVFLPTGRLKDMVREGDTTATIRRVHKSR